jgi:hypothetical protein
MTTDLEAARPARVVEVAAGANSPQAAHLQQPASITADLATEGLELYAEGRRVMGFGDAIALGWFDVGEPTAVLVRRVGRGCACEGLSPATRGREMLHEVMLAVRAKIAARARGRRGLAADLERALGLPAVGAPQRSSPSRL